MVEGVAGYFKPRVNTEEKLRTQVPRETVQYRGTLGPTYMSDDVQNRLNQAVDNEFAAKQQRKQYRQAQKANRRLERSRRKLAKETARNAAKATGYDRFMIMFNKKGEQIRVPVVYDDRAMPTPAPVYERTPRNSWTFPDCTVEMIPWMGSLRAFRVKMGSRYQTVVPFSLHDMQSRVMELNANISPVGYWYDGEGLLVCPGNGVPRNGPAKAPAKTPAKSVPAKKPAKAPAKTPAKSVPAKKPAKAPAKKGQTTPSPKRKPSNTASSANRKTKPAKNNPTAKRRC